MQSIRELLPQRLCAAMVKDLGREEALRLLWPAVVGTHLASQTRLQRIRGDVLVVSVCDGEWRGPIESLGKMILDAVNRFWERPVAGRIEFVVGPPNVPVDRSPLPPARRMQRASPPVAPPVQEGAGEPLEEAMARSAQKYFSRQEKQG